MKLPNSEIVYGVDTYPNEKENSDIGALLKIPFNKYKAPEKMDIKTTGQL
jgi:hypothetical protein